MSALRPALIGLALAAAFAAGLLLGRGQAPKATPAGFQGYEIREGRQGYLNPLLECEVHDPAVTIETRPFGRALGELVKLVELDPQVARVAVYYRDLDNGPWVGHREREGFVPASLAKVPIVVATLRQAEKDPGFLARRILYSGLKQDSDPGFANPEVNLDRGRSYTVQELILRVAEYSDNAAAQLLDAAVEPRLKAAVLADLGLSHPGGNDAVAQMSPKQYGALFRILYNASYLSRGHSTFALEAFTRSSFELGLVAGVPEEVVVSHKFGVWEGRNDTEPYQLHDCGIVYHPASPYLLCVMTAGSNYVRMSSAIAEISRFVYRQVDETALRPRS